MLEDEIRQEKGRLRERFYRSFDRCALTLALDKLINSAGSKGIAPSGSGQHFDVWQITLHGLTLAIKISNGNTPRNQKQWQQWLGLMAILRDLEPVAPLLMCSAEFWHGDRIAQIMPWGELAPKDFAKHEHQKDQLLKLSLEKTLEVMAAKNLSLGDIPQVRWQGRTPFLVDLSSLTLIGQTTWIDRSQRQATFLRR